MWAAVRVSRWMLARAISSLVTRFWSRAISSPTPGSSIVILVILLAVVADIERGDLAVATDAVASVLLDSIQIQIVAVVQFDGNDHANLHLHDVGHRGSGDQRPRRKRPCWAVILARATR